MKHSMNELKLESTLSETKPMEVKHSEVSSELKLEEVETSVESRPRKEELVELYVLSFNLPSSSLALLKTEHELDRKTNLITELRLIEGELAKKIESLRRDFYYHCDKIFETSTLGWITTTEEGIKFAEEWNSKFAHALEVFADEYIGKKLEQVQDEELRRLYQKLYRKLRERAKSRLVKVIKVYIEPEDAKELLKEIVDRLSTELEILKRRVKEAEEKKRKSQLYRLNFELSVKELKLQMFKKKLEEIK